MQAAVSPFGRYVLKARIARGGMGEVFLASAVGADGFEKRVVVKRVLPSLSGSQSFEQLFAAEARLMTRLEHPNIVQVFDYGRGSLGDAFLVMELVDGADLRAFHKAWQERHGSFPLGYASYIMQQVLRGLEFAHSKVELVHRDVSPGNVLLSRLGEVKVADFGVAQVELVDGVELVGKAGYVSPEQVAGSEVDLRSDLFAVGVMLYELVTGELPFKSRERDATPIAPRQLRADLPEAFEALILRCLAPEPEARPVSAREVSRELGRLGLPNVQPDELGEAVAELFPHEMTGEALHSLAADTGDKPLTELRRGEKGLDWAPDALSLVRQTGTIDSASIDTASNEAASIEAESNETAAIEAGWRTETLEDAPAPQLERPIGVGMDSSPPPQSPGTLQGLPGQPREQASAFESPRQQKSAKPLLVFLGVSVLLGGVLTGVYVLRTPNTAQQPAVTPSAVETTSGVPAPLSNGAASQVPAQGAAPEAPSAISSGAAPPKPSASVAKLGPLPGAQPSVAKSAQPADKPACTGALQIFSNGSWSVSGGPSAVQSPGRYVWPCGRYSLSAVSRMDSTQRKGGSVVIADGRTATLDLR
ncbi:MAG: protein kinase [Myxococcales bacterium]|nr:protein kinase [Myxococcales bacterium]